LQKWAELCVKNSIIWKIGVSKSKSLFFSNETPLYKNLCHYYCVFIF
jgi:hypothetical protein